MTDFSREILEKWQVRKNQQQKSNFIARMQQQYPQMQVETEGRCRNLVLGDVESAEVVYTAHYDTCARMPFPNLIFPKSILLSMLYGVVLGILLAAIGDLAGCLASLLSGSLRSVGMIVAPITYSVAVIGFLLMLFIGPANPHTVNDNTSGVITLVELYESMSDAQRSKAALVFFDMEELGLIGSARFKKRHSTVMEGKLLLNFDCVSDGDTIAVICGKRMAKNAIERLKDAFCGEGNKRVIVAREKEMYYPSDQKHFSQGVGVAALKGKKLLYLDRIHTRRDTVMDEENIRLIVSSAGKLAE